MAALGVGGLPQEEAAGGAADAAAQHGRDGADGGEAPGAAGAGARDDADSAGAGDHQRPAGGGDLDAINKNSPFQPVFFPLDSFEVDGSGQQALNTNAGILKKYPTWVITIEGHCDERGTAEYNLALGEKRALAAKTYLVSLGVPADRLRTVSYGKEFPFDPGHDEGAWSKNRRAHFVVTSK